MKLTTFLVYKFNRFLKLIYKPNILNTEQSIEYLLNNECSVTRFGDGEMNIILGGKINFQEFDKNLAERLKNILIQKNQDKNLVIGIPLAIRTVKGYKKISKDFWNQNMDTGRMHWMSLCNFREKMYINASVTRCYIDYENLETSRNWFNKIIQLWQDKNILIIEGKNGKLGVNNSLLSNAKSIKRITTLDSNAWEKYFEILEKTKINAALFDMVLVSLGPTASILVQDISKLGHRIIDIGHLNFEYNKYIEDGGKPLTDKIIYDQEYQEQIIEFIH